MAEEYFIVSLDFDGVLAQGLSVKLKYAKKWFGVDLDLSQTKKEGFNALMRRLGKDVNYRNLMDPLNEEHIMEYQVPKACIGALKRLFADSFRFVVITSRNDHDFPYAIQFLEKKFGPLIKYVHNTRNEPKDRFVSRLKPRVHVDDDLGKLEELQDLPIELVYFRQPENTGIEPSGELKNTIWQAESFDDVEAILNRIKEVHAVICKEFNIANDWTNISKIYQKYHSLSQKKLNRLLKKKEAVIN